jgi:hypothetical protein
MPSIENRESILKAAGEEHQITYKGKPTRIAAGYCEDTLKARRLWNDIFTPEGKQPQA